VARTQSAGLLTQLLNPNPENFPVGHPYRRGNSSSEIRGIGGRASASRGDRDRDRGFMPLEPLMDVKATKTDNIQDNKLDTQPPPSRPEATVDRKSCLHRFVLEHQLHFHLHYVPKLCNGPYACIVTTIVSSILLKEVGMGLSIVLG
jgi:hypothetical protein